MKKVTRACLTIGLGLLPILALAGTRAAIGRPVLLFNPSPSEPVGLYWLSTDAPALGRIIAFKVPQPGRHYADAHLGGVARGAILKQIVAEKGTVVCEQSGNIYIDGKPQGPVAAADRRGVPLPQWSGCQRLQVGEFFVLSNRIPNSFDSRYYGPVPSADVIGVYRPLWTE
jgi:conjugative transfer signal peptidase TraF